MFSSLPRRPQLRPYQQENISDIRDAMRGGTRRVLYQLPTGGGKSVVLGEVMDGSARRRKRVLALVHRYELVRQLVRHFASFGHAAHVIAAGGDDDPGARVTVASVQTAAKRELSAYDLVLVDEAHHACAAAWDAVLQQQADAFHLGVTATPRRLDGRGLDSHFDHMVCGPHTRQLQADGYLAPLEVHCATFAALKQLRLVGDNFAPEMLETILREYTDVALDSWEDIARDKGSTIVFGASVRHCEYYADAARKRGIRAQSVHSKMKPAAIAQVLRDYQAGELTQLVNCDLFDEGFDVPATKYVLQLRPTESIVKHFQQIGRMMRPKSDGGPGVLIDMAGNVERIREAEGAGLPTEVIEWTLQGRIQLKKTKLDDREIMQSEAGAIIVDPSAKAGRAVLLVDRFARSTSVEEALGIIEQPDDFHIFRQQIPNKKGKRYHVGAIIQFCRNRFYREQPMSVGLDMAAAALGYERFLRAARVRGDAWAGDSSSLDSEEA